MTIQPEAPDSLETENASFGCVEKIIYPLFHTIVTSLEILMTFGCKRKKKENLRLSAVQLPLEMERKYLDLEMILKALTSSFTTK